MTFLEVQQRSAHRAHFRLRCGSGVTDFRLKDELVEQFGARARAARCSRSFVVSGLAIGADFAVAVSSLASAASGGTAAGKQIQAAETASVFLRARR